MKVWVITAILLVNITIQSTILPYAQIVGIKPDALMMLVVSFALLAGSMTGAVTGFFGGFLQDIMYGGAVGYNALQYMLIGYIVGYAYHRIYIDKIVFPSLFVFCAVIIHGFFMMVYLFFLRANIPFYQSFAVVIIPEALYTAIFMPVIFFFMTILYNQKFMIKKWQFKRNKY